MPREGYGEPQPTSRYADLQHKLCMKVREARKFNFVEGGWRDHFHNQRRWAREVIRILDEDESGAWLPEIEEIYRLGDRAYDTPDTRDLTANEVLARQIRSVESFIWKLHNGMVI